MILFCSTCLPHDYQDAKYGHKMRVHNPGKAKDHSRIKWTCTVCRAEQEKPK